MSRYFSFLQRRHGKVTLCSNYGFIILSLEPHALLDHLE
jgi:hypothetical protein